MRSKDKNLMEKIKKYAEEYAFENNGNTPSTGDIGDKLGINRVKAFRYLKAMDELGMIRYADGRIYTDRIDKIVPASELSPAFLGSIPAGTPDEVDAMVEEYVAIPAVFTGSQRGRFFILRVTGESMTDAGIEDRNLVIIKESKEADAGDIVAALVNGTSSTLKRYMRDDKGAYLWAENESWTNEKRFYGRDFVIQGIAVKVIKDVV